MRVESIRHLHYTEMESWEITYRKEGIAVNVCLRRCADNEAQTFGVRLRMCVSVCLWGKWFVRTKLRSMRAQYMFDLSTDLQHTDKFCYLFHIHIAIAIT